MTITSYPTKLISLEAVFKRQSNNVLCFKSHQMYFGRDSLVLTLVTKAIASLRWSSFCDAEQRMLDIRRTSVLSAALPQCRGVIRTAPSITLVGIR